MTNFLFWNLNKKPLQAMIANLAECYELDVIMLAECTIPPEVLLVELNRLETTYDFVEPLGCTKISLFTRFPDHFIAPVHDDNRLTIRHLTLPGLTDILLAVTHFPDKRNRKESSQVLECTRLADSIRRAEEVVQHTRTVLVGDLNMNPFENGMVGAIGLHGVMTRDVASRQSRVVEGAEYPFFYNPMWGCLGDGSPGPPGSYYYPGSEQVVFFWNMFDQVLIRPELLDRFQYNSLQVLVSDGYTSLVRDKSGVPDSKRASDHLPLYFSLDL